MVGNRVDWCGEWTDWGGTGRAAGVGCVEEATMWQGGVR